MRIARARCVRAAAPMTSGELEGISAAHIAEFLLAEAERLGQWGTKASVTALRSLLRYLHLTGHIPRPLTGAVPAAASWVWQRAPRSASRNWSPGCWRRATRAPHWERATTPSCFRCGG